MMMVRKIGLGLLVALLGFLGFVARRDGKFNYERHGLIKAPAQKIYPYLTHFKLGGVWSPYERMDPNMKKNYGGVEGEVGSSMEFEGNGDVGSGRLELLGMVPNESVDIKLTMLKPFHGENFIRYALTPGPEGTRFSWSMRGDGGFMGKLMTVLIDCEKMVGDQFSKGISNLKTVVESSP